MDNIKHELSGKTGSFYLEKNGKRVASMIYMMSDEKNMIVEHTEVDESLKGQGIGKKLVKELVTYSRENQIKVRSTCHFVSTVLDKTPEWQDILA